VTATQPPSHVAVAITLNAKASSLKTLRRPGTPLEELTTLPQTPYLVGMGWLPLPKNHTPALGPSGIAFPIHSKIISDAVDLTSVFKLSRNGLEYRFATFWNVPALLSDTAVFILR